jgi:hypothetical protein
VVTRHPALRGSDVQKVRAVFKPQLEHLYDVIVFPSKGIFPLAERMQNGDYDGDTYWACWEPAIVQHFKNLPSPPNLPSPETFGIQVNKETIDETFTSENPNSMKDFLCQGINFRYEKDFLGECTNLHTMLAYKVKSINSADVLQVADLHDLLVDRNKSGYTFSEDAWKKFAFAKRRHELEKPAYKQAVEARSRSEIAALRAKDTLDRLFLHIIIPGIDLTIKEVQGVLSESLQKDEVLCRPFMQAKKLAETNLSQFEALKLVGEEIKEIYNIWSRCNNPTFPHDVEKDFVKWRHCLEQCYKKFRALQPKTDVWKHFHDEQRLESSLPTRWDYLKASIAYDKFWYSSFSFRISGKELGLLKSWDTAGSRAITATMHAKMKPK